MIKLSKNGYPDLLCHKAGETMYIEVKRSSGVLSELQKIRIKELRDLGITVKIWQGYGIDYITK